MKNRVKCVEVKTNDGKVILSFCIYDKEIVTESKPDNQSSSPKAKVEKEGGNNSQDNGDLMTDAQKRYLFRLLADQGIEGDDALEHLKERFQVELLKDVSKTEASNMIESLLSDSEKGGGDDRPPF